VHGARGAAGGGACGAGRGGKSAPAGQGVGGWGWEWFGWNQRVLAVILVLNLSGLAVYSAGGAKIFGVSQKKKKKKKKTWHGIHFAVF
jgi:hypothetical protein